MRPWKLHTLIAAAFVASRVAFAYAGVKFDATPLDEYWQYLDRRWLEHDLLRSTFYMHSQPPGFNLLLGAVLKVAPGAFQALFLAMGLAVCLLAFGLMRRMGGGHRLSAGFTLLMMLSPTSVLLENRLFYDLLVQALLVGAAYALIRYLDEDRSIWLLLFCSTVLALSITRSLFHFVWIAAIAAALAKAPRRLVVALGVTTVLAAVPAIKNKIVFDKLTPSTWLGMNFAHVVQGSTSHEVLQRLAASGEISRVSLVRPFSSLAEYPADTRVPSRFEDVPALSVATKASGKPNYNHYGYIAVSDLYLRDALVLLKLRPLTAVRGLGDALDRFMRPGSVEPLVAQNQLAIARYDAFWNRVVLGLIEPGPRKRIYLLLIAGTLISLAFGSWLATRESSSAAVTARFMILTAAFVIIVGNALERDENHRFRTYLAPFLITFLALGATRVRDLWLAKTHRVLNS